MELSDGERLILIMLCEIHEHLKVQGEIDPKLVKSAIFHGNLWGLKSEYSGLFDVEETPEDVVREVTDVLDMWSFLEEGYEQLSAADKKQVAAEAGPIGKHVQFTGFDGNNEIQHMGAARFMVKEMGKFSRFKGRELNSHMPSIEAYHRMLGVFESMRASLESPMTAAQIIQVLKAKIHPDMRK